MHDEKTYHPETIALHGSLPFPYGPIQTPIVNTTAYKFKNAVQAKNLFALAEVGNIYSRLTNPTVDELSSRLAKIHNASGAFCTSSGHAAQLLTFFNLLQPGDHVVASQYLYGGSITQLTHTFPRQFGWHSALVDIDNIEEVKSAIKPNTKCIYVESQSNPNGVIADLEELAKVAHKNGIPLIVDNTVATPYLLNPFDFGADIAIYSLSKYVSGNNSVIGGAVVDSGNFDWSQNNKFPLLTEPDYAYNGVVFYNAVGKLAFTIRGIAVGLRDLGATMSPYTASDVLKGLETLHIRMQRHSENAKLVAEYLQNHSKIKKVYFPHLDNSPYKKLAEKYLPKGASSLFGVEIDGSYEKVSQIVDNVNVFIHCAQIGDVRSLIIHPASTTHSQLTPLQRENAGAKDNYVRLSIGIENIQDIIDDLEHVLKQI